MSTSDRMNLLDYLPPQQKQKVLTLVQRLKEESEQKQKYKALHEQSERKLNQMTLTCNQLKDENKLLKEQIHNSFSIVAQVRASFKENQQKRKEVVSKEEEWQDEEDEENEENQQNAQNQLSATKNLPQSHQSHQSHKSPLDKYRPPMTTSKKTPSNLNLSSNELNKTNMNSSRSKELVDLKKQIQEMQYSKRKGEEKKKQTYEKMRLVDEIKNRYKGGEDSSRKSVEAKQEAAIERIDITHAFENEQRSQASKEKSRHHEQSEEKRPARKQQKGKKEVAQTKKQLKSPSKSYVVTADDYDDVLSMINCSN